MAHDCRAHHRMALCCFQKRERQHATCCCFNVLSLQHYTQNLKMVVFGTNAGELTEEQSL